MHSTRKHAFIIVAVLVRSQ